MNPRTLLVPLVLSIVGTAPQMTLGQKLFDLGPKVGASMNDLDLHASHTSVLGWHAGAFARVKPSLFPGVQGELLLSSMGSDVHFDGATDAHVRTLALQIPLFLVFSLGPAELHAGGYADKVLSSSVTGGTDAEGNTQSSGDLTNGGYGLLVGAGVHLGQLYVGARYNYGLQGIGTGDGYLGDAGNRQAQIYLALGLFK